MFRKMNLTALAAVLACITVLFACTQNQQAQPPVTKTFISTGGSVSNAPYSPGVIVGNTFYCSGRLGTDPSTGNLGDGIGEQTRLALESIKSVLAEGGFEMKDIVSVNVYLSKLEDYAAMNDAYRTFFPSNPPARATVQAGLVLDALVEISCIAVKTN